MDFLEKAPDFEVPRSLACTYHSQKKGKWKKKKNEKKERRIPLVKQKDH